MSHKEEEVSNRYLCKVFSWLDIWNKAEINFIGQIPRKVIWNKETPNPYCRIKYWPERAVVFVLTQNKFCSSGENNFSKQKRACCDANIGHSIPMNQILSFVGENLLGWSNEMIILAYNGFTWKIIQRRVEMWGGGTVIALLDVSTYETEFLSVWVYTWFFGESRSR